MRKQGNTDALLAAMFVSLAILSLPLGGLFFAVGLAISR